MKILGWAFTVMILFASIAVMITAMLVYATHTNWRDSYQALNTKLQTEQAKNADLEASYLRQISLLEAEREAAQQDVRKLETERLQLDGENKALQSDLDQAKEKNSQLFATVTTTEQNNHILSEEVTQLRQGIRTAQQERDELFDTTLQATTKLHTTAGQLAQVKERNDQLVQDLAQKTATMRELGIDPNTDATPRVRGVIVASRRIAGGQLIEISVGADDGIKQGQTVEIFRGERYLGRAEITKADPDRAVGQVLREYQQGQIQEGDDVATQLRVG
ncbi:MAG: hypothetical protein KDA44_09600 [Planctomycetales bacterium]|nr:hypothetical protein [Planctomycetales bacterium]